MFSVSECSLWRGGISEVRVEHCYSEQLITLLREGDEKVFLLDIKLNKSKFQDWIFFFRGHNSSEVKMLFYDKIN